MECRDITSDMLADLVLEPSAPQHSSGPLFDHLAACDSCRRRAAEIKAVFDATGRGMEQVPAALDEAVRAFARRPEPQRAAAPAQAADPGRAFPVFFRRHGLVVGAAAAALLVGVLLGFAASSSTGSRAPVPGAEPARKTGLDERIDAQAARIRSLESRLESGDARQAALSAEIAALRAEAADGAVKAAAAAKLLADAQAQITVLQEGLARSERDRDLAQEAAAAVQASRDALLARVGRLEADLERGGRELIVAKESAFRLERDSAALKGALAAARAENETLVARSAELVSAITVRGDMNGDGSSDIADSMRIVAMSAAGRGVAYSPSSDLNGDGKVDVADAMLIARMSAGAAR